MKRLMTCLLTVIMLPGLAAILILLVLAGSYLLQAAADWLALRQELQQADLPLSVCLADVKLAAEVPDALRVCCVAPQDRERVAQALSKQADWHIADEQADWGALIGSHIPGAAGLIQPTGIDLWTSDRKGFALWDTQSGLLLLGKRGPAQPGETRWPLERMGLDDMAEGLDAVPVLKQPVRWTSEMADMRAFLVPEAQHTAMLTAIAQSGWIEFTLTGGELTRLQQRYLPTLDVLVPSQEAIFDWWAFNLEDEPTPSSLSPDEAFAVIGDWDAAFYDADSGLFLWYRCDF